MNSIAAAVGGGCGCVVWWMVLVSFQYDGESFHRSVASCHGTSDAHTEHTW